MSLNDIGLSDFFKVGQRMWFLDRHDGPRAATVTFIGKQSLSVRIAGHVDQVFLGTNKIKTRKQLDKILSERSFFGSSADAINYAIDECNYKIAEARRDRDQFIRIIRRYSMKPVKVRKQAT